MGDSPSRKVVFSAPSLPFLQPLQLLSSLPPLFLLFASLRKRRRSSRGTGDQYLYISLLSTPSHAPTLAVAKSWASTRQGWASHLAGPRQHWKVLLVDHKDHARSPGAAPAMEKALLRPGGRRTGTAGHRRTAGEPPRLGDAGFCSLLIGQQLPAPARVREML